MKKTVFALAIATAITAPNGSAFAKPVVTTISIDDFCDVLTVTQKGDRVAMTEDPNCAVGLGGGLVVKTKQIGEAADFSTFYPNDGSGMVFNLLLSEPFVTGGTWILYETQDGVTENFFFEGTYTVGGAAAPERRGARSITSLIRRNSN
jgi:hypothetical protein